MGECQLEAWILAGLAPPLSSQEERPPDREDYEGHVTKSLQILRSLETGEKISEDTAPSILLLCSQHSSGQSAWSSGEHQQVSRRLLAVLEEKVSSVAALLSQTGGKMFKALLCHLQPSLETFIRQPGSVRSLVWLAEQLEEPQQVEMVVPLVLPHLLRWLDCWLPHFKLEGCHLARHIAAHSNPSHLIFYGRAELLTEPLTRLMSSTEASVVRAAGQPLLALTSIRHRDDLPASPGQADTLLASVISSLEVSSDRERRTVYWDLLSHTVTLLGVGAARWVSVLTGLAISQLDLSPPSPPASVFSTLSQLASLVPDCVAREISPLLAAMFKYIYRVTSGAARGGQGEMLSDLSDVTECLQQVARCDIDTARLLCVGLQQTSVNKTFDTVTLSVITNLNI